MKGRPNNYTKQITRSKSPALPPAFSFPLQPKSSTELPSTAIPELARLNSADAKLRLSSPQPPREVKKIERISQNAIINKAGTTDGGVRLIKMEGLTKKDEDENTTTQQSSSQHLSYVTGEYQLDSYDMFSKRKNVKFEDSSQELQRVGKVRCSGGKTSSRNSSILKNSSRVLDRSLASSEKSLSIQNSFTATRKCKIGLNTLQDNGNMLMRRKFDGIIEQMKIRNGESKEKYIDQLFPPVEASIFTSSMHRKGIISRGKDEIVWMRLSEVFPLSTKVFTKTKSHQSMVITRGEKNYAQSYFVSSLNSIKGNNELLEFMFEKEEVNKYGVYLIKIYQENTWKYVIVDDLVPCIRRRSKKQEKFTPVFVNVSGCQAPLLWPFLLEKAYANYYSCYQNLGCGNAKDFISELTGVPYREIQLNSKKIGKQVVQKQLASLGTFFMSSNPIALGWNEDRTVCYPISLLRQTFVGQNILLGLHDPANNYEPLRLELNQLPSLVTSVYCYAFGEYPNYATCPVYPPKIIKERTRKPKDEKLRYLQIPPNDTTSLRTFTVFKKSKYCMNIRQKEIRFYSQCGIAEYLWVRCLFLQKEYDGGFRWVGGRYSNQKHIIFEEQLEPGQYYLVITVEWRQRYNKQLTIMLYSQSEYLKFERRNYNKEERLVEMACMDLAQRYGKLNQINKSICSYTLLCQDTGLIIQNIVNQRTKGEVTIMRSINGLKSRVEIIPLNVEFEVDAPEEYGAMEKGQRRRVLTQSVEIDIQKGESFTVVLRMRGGIDRKFFKVFNFG